MAMHAAGLMHVAEFKLFYLYKTQVVFRNRSGPKKQNDLTADRVAPTAISGLYLLWFFYF